MTMTAREALTRAAEICGEQSYSQKYHFDPSGGTLRLSWCGGANAATRNCVAAILALRDSLPEGPKVPKFGVDQSYEQKNMRCALGFHVAPYRGGSNYYCSHCKKGMGNSYFELREAFDMLTASLLEKDAQVLTCMERCHVVTEEERCVDCPEGETPRTDALDRDFATEVGSKGATVEQYHHYYMRARKLARQLERELAAVKEKQAWRNKHDPVTRLHNLCDGLQREKGESPYGVKAWDELQAENDSLRKELTDLRTRNVHLAGRVPVEEHNAIVAAARAETRENAATDSVGLDGISCPRMTAAVREARGIEEGCRLEIELATIKADLAKAIGNHAADLSAAGPLSNERPTREQIEAFYREHLIRGNNAGLSPLEPWAVEENFVLNYLVASWRSFHCNEVVATTDRNEMRDPTTRSVDGENK